MTLKALFDRSSEGDSTMIGLRRTASDQTISTLCKRIGRQKLKLAGLVATRC
jgi:hypothetical protein